MTEIVNHQADRAGTERDRGRPAGDLDLAALRRDLFTAVAGTSGDGEGRWRAAVDAILKGAAFEQVLVSRTADGCTFGPLYRRHAGAQPVPLGRGAQRWRVLARVDQPELDGAQAGAVGELEGGADGLALVFAGSAGAHGRGLPCTNARDLDAILRGVDLDLIALRVEPAPQARIVARQVAQVVRERRLNPADLDVSFNFDQIGLLLRSGVLRAAWPDIGMRLTDMMAEFRGLGFTGALICCDGRAVHAAGGSEGQELGFVLAAATAYVRAIEAAGGDGARAADAMAMTLAVDAGLFTSLAKLRAARRLWASWRAALGLQPRKLSLHAETAWRMLTTRDLPTNLLRNTVASLAAGLGGADTLSVLPHTLALGAPDDEARRLARTTQLVLLEESQVWRLNDPATGSGGIEALTEGLCAAGWSEFQQIEREGGLIDSLVAGAFQQRLGTARDQRNRAIATGRTPLTGISAYPDLAERIEDRPAHRPGDAPPEGASHADRMGGSDMLRPSARPRRHGGRVDVTPLPSVRLSEPFERLRDRADHLRQQGTPPRAVLVGLGPASAHGARVDFARGLLAAGGIASEAIAVPIDGCGEIDLMALTQRLADHRGALICLCGADAAYETHAEGAALALLASGHGSVWIAGRPGANEARWRAAGISRFIHLGCDMIEALTEGMEAASTALPDHGPQRQEASHVDRA